MALELQVENACQFINKRWKKRPRVGIVLGSGLGDFANEIDIETQIHYNDIPHFVQTTVQGHRGELICGNVAGQSAIAMQGRSHRYEGYNGSQITFPIHVLCKLGIELLIVSNAAGGLNWKYSAGDVMMIDSHLDLLFTANAHANRLRESERADRQCIEPYDQHLLSLAMEHARREQFPLHQGVYCAVSGPTYETRAEYRMFRKLGADAVGMSTTPEVGVANQHHVRVVGMSTITNIANPDVPQKTTHAEVIQTAKMAGKTLRSVVLHLIAYGLK